MKMASKGVLAWEAKVAILEGLRRTLRRTEGVLEDESLLQIGKALSDRNAVVRITALELCAEFKLKVTANRVVGLLRDKDGVVRGNAAIALGRIGGHGSILRQMYESEVDDSARVRVALALVGRPKFPKSVFLGYLRSADYRVRCSVINYSSELRLTSAWFERNLKLLVKHDLHSVSWLAARRLRELERGP